MSADLRLRAAANRDYDFASEIAKPRSGESGASHTGDAGKSQACRNAEISSHRRFLQAKNFAVGIVCPAPSLPAWLRRNHEESVNDV